MFLRQQRRSRTTAAALAFGLALTLAACGGTTQESTNNQTSGGAATAGATGSGGGATEYKEGLAITMLPKQVNNPYFETSSEGAKKAVEDLKGTYEYTGPSDASASSQVSYINTLTQQAVDAILLSANDPNALCSSLEQAMAGDTAVVTFDSDVDPSCRDVFVSQVDGEEVGKTLIQMASEQIGGSGQIAILSATANATNQNAWIKVIEDELKNNPDYTDIQLVTTVYGDDQDQKSFSETQGLLQANPDVKAIISPTTVGIAAAARYLQGSDYKGKVMLTGLGTPNQMREFVKDGTVTEFALWDPGALGQLAAYTGAAMASGIITGKEGESFEAGDLGKYEIGKDGVIVLGPPTRFNADNIDDFNF